jgi:hypothetical protein
MTWPVSGEGNKGKRGGSNVREGGRPSRQPEPEGPRRKSKGGWEIWVKKEDREKEEGGRGEGKRHRDRERERERERENQSPLTADN